MYKKREKIGVGFVSGRIENRFENALVNRSYEK